MTTRDTHATAAGTLLIVATAASLTATACYASFLDGSDFLTSVASHQGRMLTGALFELVAAFASAAIAISLYPVLRQHAPAMALGSVGFRLIEGTFYALAAASVLVLVSLAGDVAGSGSLQQSADLMRHLHEATALAGILAFYIGGTLYYLVFYRSRLIPRWLSVWGLVGTTLGAVAGVLVLFQALSLMSAGHTLLNVPIGVQELVLAVWLLVKGFSAPTSPRAVAAQPSVNLRDAEQAAAPPLPAVRAARSG